MNDQVIYVGNDATMSILIRDSNGAVLDLTAAGFDVVSAEIHIGNISISSIAYPDVFDWTTDGANGKIHFDFTGLAIPVGSWGSRLVIYSLAKPYGVVVADGFLIIVQEAITGAAPTPVDLDALLDLLSSNDPNKGSDLVGVVDTSVDLTTYFSQIFDGTIQLTAPQIASFINAIHDHGDAPGGGNTLNSPGISDFSNALHNHEDAAGGDTLGTAALGANHDTDPTLAADSDTRTVSQKAIAAFVAAQIAASGTYISSHITGLTLSNNDIDPANDIDISTGVAGDSTRSVNMFLHTALTKQIDAAWTEGNNAGGLDTGVVAVNTWYYVHVIGKTDGTTDALISLSATAPTQPSGYTLKRRLGAILTDGSANILAFLQSGNSFRWDVPKNDLAFTNIHTAQTARVLTVPDAIEVETVFSEIFKTTTDGATVTYYGLALDPRATDTTPSASNANMVARIAGGGTEEYGTDKQIYTNDGTVNFRWSGTPTPGAAQYSLTTFGWNDDRSI